MTKVVEEPEGEGREQADRDRGTQSRKWKKRCDDQDRGERDRRTAKHRCGRPMPAIGAGLDDHTNPPGEPAKCGGRDTCQQGSSRHNERE